MPVLIGISVRLWMWLLIESFYILELRPECYLNIVTETGNNIWLASQ